MEIKSPHSPYKAIKRATLYFEKLVSNSNIKEEPSSRKDPQELEVGVTTVFGEIFWMKINAKRSVDKTSIVFVRSSPGTRQLFLSAIVILLSGPFFYMAFNSMNPFVFIVAGFLLLLGIASMIMPFFRIRSTKKGLKKYLTTDEEITSGKEVKDELSVTSSRLELS
jgi:hypothetical protein